MIYIYKLKKNINLIKIKLQNLSKAFLLKKSYISPKLIQWKMVDNNVTNIKGDV